MAPSGSRPSAPVVKPLEIKGVRYEALTTSAGTVGAFDMKTGKELWKTKVYEYYQDPKAPTSMETFIRSIVFTNDDESLLIEDEVGRKYALSLKDKKVRPLNKPVKASIISFAPTDTGWKYQVEVVIENDYNRVLQLDGVSVAEDGKLSNNLFRVKANGKEISYRGMMAKRSAPDAFIKLKPGTQYKAIVDMDSYYPLPAGPLKVSVQFASTNHFSPDSFVMESTPDEREFSGTWKRGAATPPKPTNNI